MRDINNTTRVVASLGVYVGRLVLEIAERLVSRILDSWDQEQDALGRAWAELSPRTVAEKGFDRILYETGGMRASTYAERTGPLSAAAGVRDPKISVHEWGVPERNIPARPVLGPAVQWAEREGVIEDVGEDLFASIVLRGL